MKKFVHNFIYSIGVLALVFTAYVSTFYLTLNTVIRPFERESPQQTHSIRPAYNVIYYPLRWFVANGLSFKATEQETYFGALIKPNFVIGQTSLDMRSAILNNYNNATVFLGFTGSRSNLNEFDQIEYDTYLKLVVGKTLQTENDRFMNQLVSFEVIELMDDPHIKKEKLSKIQRQNVLTTFNSLQGRQKNCALKFISDYKQSKIKHCMQAGYAQNIGGGCHHGMNIIRVTTMKHALNSCKILLNDS